MKRTFQSWGGVVRAALVFMALVVLLVGGGCRKATAVDEEAATLQEMAKIFSEATDVLNGIHGKADGAAAAPKLRALVARAKQLSDNRPKQQPVTFAQANDLNRQYGKAVSEGEGRLVAAMNRARSSALDGYWEVQPSSVELAITMDRLMSHGPPLTGPNTSTVAPAAPAQRWRNPKSADEAERQYVERFGADRVARVELTQIAAGVKWDLLHNKMTKPPITDSFTAGGPGPVTFVVAPISGSLSQFADDLEVGQILSVDYAKHLIRTTVDAAKFAPPAEAKP